MQAFNEVMLTGTVSEAARNLHRSQPAISALIGSLENELGMSLFERRKGRLHPVPEARYLQQECAQILERIQAVRSNLAKLQTLESGELSVVSMPGPSVSVLPELIATLAEHRSDMQTTLMSRSSDAVVQLIAAQRHDVGLADAQALGADVSPLVHAERHTLRCRCAVPIDHPLAERERIGPQDLAGESLAALYPEHSSRQATERCLAAAGVVARVRFTAQYFLPCLNWVERGLAVSIVDPISMESYRIARDTPRIRFLPFDPAIVHEVVLLTPAHRPASMLGTAFIDALRRELVRLTEAAEG